MINLYINIYTHQQSLLSINARLQCQVTFYGSCLCHISTYNGRTNSSPQQPVHRCRYLISSMNNWSRVHLSYRYLVSRSTNFASVLIHRTEQKLVLSNKQKKITVFCTSISLYCLNLKGTNSQYEIQHIKSLGWTFLRPVRCVIHLPDDA